MVTPVLSVIEEWTGERVTTCPWLAFFDPFVARALDALPAFEKGSLATVLPNPSHRLVSGILFLHRKLNAIECEQIRRDNEKARNAKR